MTTTTPVSPPSATALLEMQRLMLRIRRFDEAATRLLHRGEMPGVLHLTTGQEAGVVGTCVALRPNDVQIGGHRNHGHPVARGADLNQLMAEVLGKATGVCKGKAGELHLIAPAVGALFSSAILGSGLPVAVGTALTSKVKRTGSVTIAVFGEGASNEGAVHEAMNLASIWKLPIVFICENNGYAVTVAASYSLSVTDVADRAAGYGMPGVIVQDGGDPVAVRDAVSAAVERARGGEGPSLVEIKTYRTVDHAENLPSQPYRDEQEVAHWRERDPIARLRARLLEQGATEQELEQLEAAVEEEVATAVEFALASAYPEPEALWQDMYVDERLNAASAWEEGGEHA
jgi:TPP-dependent pyruvate/acetoin dehydrogenase alpha subunit